MVVTANITSEDKHMSLSEIGIGVIDKATRKYFNHEVCEDPFCCTVTRREIINGLRKEFGLPQLTEADDRGPVENYE